MKDGGKPRRERGRERGLFRSWLPPSLAAIFFLSGCNLFTPDPSILERIRERGALRIVTRYAPTTLFEGPDQRMGFEHDLAVAFARRLGATPQFIILETQPDILDAVRREEGDLAAAGLTQDPRLAAEFRFGPTYQQVDQQVVCRRGGRRPTNLLRLARVDISVPQGSSSETRLRELATIVPDLTWDSDEGRTTEQIMERVWKGEIDCTIAESNVVAINRRHYPELVVKFPINATQNLAWVMPKRAFFLQREMSEWFAEIERSGWLHDLRDRYYGHFDRAEYDYVDNRAFIKRITQRLPQFRRLFQEAGERYGIPWRLLAAQAYQESHWDPEARSPTGVRGIMMLTQVTARSLGVQNRQDPEESITAGAWYLADMKRRLPSTILEPDRTWLALAAYNVGLGHVRDARRLARTLGEDPDMWKSLQEILPLLSNQRYFSQLRYGYARGQEPVDYVRKIRAYYDVLVQRDSVMARGSTPTPGAPPLRVDTPSLAGMDDTEAGGSVDPLAQLAEPLVSLVE